MYFDKKFREQLRQLFLWRRDVRRFCTDPVPDDILKHIVRQAMLAPSVGYAQPWRFVSVKSLDKRQKVIANYERSNNEASTIYDTERAKLYRSLKLSGLKDAPIHLAIFSEKDTTTGRGLGRQTMPETLDYSVVAAIENLWLAARAYGIGMGWVSIIDPEEVKQVLQVPENWRLIGYMCIGYPVEEHEDPELMRAGWEKTKNWDSVFFEK